MNNRFAYTALLFLFTLAGCSGLIYESIWSRYLGLFLGHAAYAQTLVITLFMGGMGIGAWIIGKYSPTIRKLLVAYAVVECAIGVFGIFFHYVFSTVTGPVFLDLISGIDSLLMVSTIKWGLAALLILPQTILLGMTFPLMVGGALRIFRDATGKVVSSLYYANSIGASFGVIICGFFFVQAYGLPVTIAIAGWLNIFISVSVVLLYFLFSLHSKSEHMISNHVSEDSSTTYLTASRYRLLLLCSLLTGMASFIYEIGWIRMLSMVLGSSTHSFELMLSTFILGLAIGSYLIRTRIDSLKSSIKTLAVIQLVMGISALCTIPFYGQIFHVMSFFVESLSKSDSGYLLFSMCCYVICALFMLPTTILAGMTLPIITNQLVKSPPHGESAIGKVYSVNTIGAIIGVVFSVQFLMPLVGLKNLLVCGALIDICLGFALYRAYKNESPAKRHYAFYAVSTVAGCFVIFCMCFYELDPLKMASGVFRHGGLDSTMSSEFHSDGKTASVSVTRKDDVLTLVTNGKPDASICLNNKVASLDDLTQILTGALPLLATDAKKVAVIGLGSGVSSHVLLHDEKVELVDVIEIESAIVEGAKLFGDRSINNFTDSRVKIHIDDAKTFFMSNQQTYDVIVSEPSNPWVSGIASLFTKEFYNLTKRYLSKNGVFVQWLQLYEMDFELVSSALKALSSEFKYYDAFFTSEGNMVLLASNKGNISLSGSIFENEKIKSELKRIGIRSMEALQSHYIGNQKILAAISSTYDIPVNSDYFPVLDNGAAKARFMKKNAGLSLMDVISYDFPLHKFLLEGRDEYADIAVTPMREVLFSNLKHALDAQTVYHYLMTGKMRQSVSTADILSNLRVLENYDLKKGDALFGRVWLESYKFILGRCMPYLTKKQLMRMNIKILMSGVHLKLAPLHAEWVKLYSAVAREDLKVIKHVTQTLLPKRAAPDDMRFLIVANAVASIKLEKYSEAKKTLTIGKRYFTEKKNLIYRMLLGMTTVK